MRGSGPGWSRSTTSDPMGSGKLDALAQLPAGPARIRSLGTQAAHLDALFYHREPRKVRKDGTVSYLGQFFEVPYALVGKTVTLVVDAHAGRVVSVESAAGEDLGRATLLDREANAHRKRHQPGAAATAVEATADPTSLVEIAHKKYYGEDEQ